jgi:RNA polymerase sigma-B factor
VTASRDDVRAVCTEELIRRQHDEPDERVLEEIVTRLEPLARGIARRYYGRGEPPEDLNQVAMVGLLKAIKGFDPDRGFAFSTYATPTMLGELKRHFRDTGWAMHVPRSVKERALEVARVSDELSGTLGRSPSLEELASALGATEEQTLEAIEAYHARQAPSLEQATDDEFGLSPASLLGAEDERLEQTEYLSVIAAGVDSLSESERLILFLRFGRDLTQSEIAQRVGTSQMKISRVLRRAIEKIRAASGESAEGA